MVGIPAKCDFCGNIFVGDGFCFDNSTNITLNNNATNCSKCGHTARFIDGNFDFVGEVLKVNAAPPRTFEILAVLQGALRAAKEGKDESDIISGLQECAPELAKRAKSAIRHGGKPHFVAILTLMLAQCSMETTATVDLNRLFDQALVATAGTTPYPFPPEPNDRQAKISVPQQITRSKLEKPAVLSRQQRRRKERQSKKDQQRTERKSQSKPNH